MVRCDTSIIHVCNRLQLFPGLVPMRTMRRLLAVISRLWQRPLIFGATIALMSVVCTSAAVANPRSAGWTKYPANPVIGGDLGTVFDVAVLKEGSIYRMWASWRPRKSIALFESRDGVHWGEPSIVLGPTQSGWEDDVNRPGVIKLGGVYHMWYTGQAGAHSWIGYATSSDGRRWRRASKTPVLSAEQPWEKQAVMCPQVLWNAKHHEFRLWYSAGEQYEPDAIGYATSRDGIHWKKYSANPIFKSDPGTSWEQVKVTGAQVLQHGDWFYMFYIGFRDVDHAQIGIASSRDGISDWERLPENPVISPDANSWDADACYKPSVIFDGRRWLLWYNGRRGNVEQIGLAIHDGEDLGFTPVVHQTVPSASSKNSLLDVTVFRPYVEDFNHQDSSQFPTTIPNDAAWQWMADNIPRFDAPDEDMVRTYYFRWWTYRKHLRTTPLGYVITEFLPDVPWAGRYNTISCAAAHHIYEGRWLRNSSYVDDYLRFWLSPYGDPRRYSSWIADAAYASYLAIGDKPFVVGLLPKLVENFKAWEATNRDSTGMFWQQDDRDGMEKSIGGSGYRPTINSYMYGDARAVSRIARLKHDSQTENLFSTRAQTLHDLVELELWNSDDAFYETRSRVTKNLVGVRELIGYIPWYFNLPTRGHEVAWKQLFDPNGFFGRFGPTTAERRNPRFLFVDPHECLWNGPSWPFATTQTLVALANLLNNYDQHIVTASQYFQLLRTYAQSQRRHLDDGGMIPWIDEDLDADSGEWIARETLTRENRPDRNRGEYYNHSTFADLVITGLVGLRPRPDDVLEINPLLPAGVWKYFALDSVPYHGRLISVVYDEDGDHYGRGKGLLVFADGTLVASAPKLGRVFARLSKPARPSLKERVESQSSHRLGASP